MNLDWLLEDKKEFDKYNFLEYVLENVESFYKAKESFLLEPSSLVKSYEMKREFQHLHSALKSECANRNISTLQLEELTELLKREV